MVKARQRREADPRGEASRQRLTGTARWLADKPAEWPRWILGAVLAVIIIAVLVARQVLAPLSGDGTSPRSMATLEAPDFHSLLVDPSNPDHILFGAHSGIQESRNGGFNWEAGTLRNADAMSMAASPVDPETLFVAGHDVFQVSRDGGQTWQPVAHDLPGTDLHAFAQDPTDPRRLYTLVVGAGVFSSTDGGTKWAPLPTQPPGLSGHGALVTDGVTLYAATAAGIVRSPDGGTTWERAEGQPSGMVLSLTIPSATLRTLYAGTESGVAKSTDGGATWVSLGPNEVPVLALAVAPSDPNRVFIVSDTGAVYRSDDGGASWLAPQ